jgi:hypothetical protein
VEKIAGEMGQETPMARVEFAGFTGTAIEFYDFYLYGLAAALVFGGRVLRSSLRYPVPWPPSPRSGSRSSPGL